MPIPARVANVSGDAVRPVKVSFQAGQQHATYARNRAAWIAADELGVDAIFNWDHLLAPTGDPHGPHFEAYAMLAAMAEVTTNPQIGCLVTCKAFRNPNLLADMIRTIDHISAGRAVLGIGAGWNASEFIEYGYDYAPDGRRLLDLENSLEAISKRMSVLNPGPVDGHIPVLIGGSGEKVMLRIVAQYADMWHLFGDAETVRHKAAILDEWCARVGRNPADIERCVDIRAETVGDLDAFVESGFSHVTVAETGPEFDMGFLREMIQWRDHHR